MAYARGTGEQIESFTVYLIEEVTIFAGPLTFDSPCQCHMAHWAETITWSYWHISHVNNTRLHVSLWARYFAAPGESILLGLVP